MVSVPLNEPGGESAGGGRRGFGQGRRRDEPNFEALPDSIPPQNLEAEEAVLGGILLDPDAIGRFTVKKQTGGDDVLFGTVTNGDVAEAIEAATKKELDRRDISVPDIHRTGSYKVQVKLHSEVTAEINLEVVSY